MSVFGAILRLTRAIFLNCLGVPRFLRSAAKRGAAPVAGEQRKLAAIVAADVGYSPDLASHAVGPLAKANRQFLFGEAER